MRFFTFDHNKSAYVNARTNVKSQTMSAARMANNIKESLPVACSNVDGDVARHHIIRNSTVKGIFHYSDVKHLITIPKEKDQAEDYEGVPKEELINGRKGDQLVTGMTKDDWEDFFDDNKVTDLDNLRSCGTTDIAVPKTIGAINVLPSIRKARKLASPCHYMDWIPYDPDTAITEEGHLKIYLDKDETGGDWQDYKDAINWLKGEVSGINQNLFIYTSVNTVTEGFIRLLSVDTVTPTKEGYTTYPSSFTLANGSTNYKSTYRTIVVKDSKLSAKETFDVFTIPTAIKSLEFDKEKGKYPSSTAITRNAMIAQRLVDRIATAPDLEYEINKFYLKTKIINVAITVEALLLKLEEYLVEIDAEVGKELEAEEKLRDTSVGSFIEAIEATESVYKMESGSNVSRTYIDFMFSRDTTRLVYNGADGKAIYKEANDFMKFYYLGKAIPDWRNYCYVVLDSDIYTPNVNTGIQEQNFYDVIYLLDYEKIQDLNPSKYNTLVLSFMYISVDTVRDTFEWDSWTDVRQVLGIVVMTAIAYALAPFSGGTSVAIWAANIGTALMLISAAVTIAGIIDRDPDMMKLGEDIGKIGGIIGVGAGISQGGKEAISTSLKYAVSQTPVLVDKYVYEPKREDWRAELKSISTKVDEVEELQTFQEQETLVKNFIFGDVETKIDKYSMNSLWQTPYDKYLKK